MRVKKKGQAGQAKNFLTRTQAVRKLQISLPDFRRLCIFKGIYPREPRNKKKASKSSTASTTFYYTKDIQYLLHEPLLAKFRDHKALAKKIARSLGRGEISDAARLEKKGAGKLSLDHVIKERYPTFVDALRDLDDALSLLSLFANLPSTSTVPPKTIALCQRLCHEFQHYLITTNSLRKSFLSIKGIYYQATIQGQDILWLIPYKFVQRVTGDVDFRIMGTFVEFYTTLLGFVNFRLYTSVGLVYPPRFDAKTDEQGGELGAFTLEGRGLPAPDQIEAPVNGTHALSEETQKTIANLPTEDESTGVDSVPPEQPLETAENAPDTIDTFTSTAPDADTLPQPQSSTNEISGLFAPYTFYVSRETPRAPLEFLLRSFGCKRIGWDAILGSGAFTTDEANPAITHQIVDRPPLVSISGPDAASLDADTNREAPTPTARPGHRFPGRTYVQPQWVWDSINAVQCLRPDFYAPGAALPPHLSPWVKPTKGQYDPTAPLAEQEREGEAEDAELQDAEMLEADSEEEEDEDEDDEDTPIKQTANITLNEAVTKGAEGMTIAVANNTDSDDSNDDGDNDAFDGFAPEHNRPSSITIADDNDNDNDSSDSEATAQRHHQLELEAEAAGLAFPPPQNPHLRPKSHRKADGTPLKGILKSSSFSSSASSLPSYTTPVSSDDAAKAAAAAAAQRKRKRQQRDQAEELERRKMMLGNRKRKLVERMMEGQRRGEVVAEGLRGKRRRVEKRGGAQMK